MNLINKLSNYVLNSRLFLFINLQMIYDVKIGIKQTVDNR